MAHGAPEAAAAAVAAGALPLLEGLLVPMVPLAPAALGIPTEKAAQQGAQEVLQAVRDHSTAALQALAQAETPRLVRRLLIDVANAMYEVMGLFGLI